MRIAVLVSGNGSNLQALLDSDVRAHIVQVISNKPGVKSLERAEKAGCPAEVIQKSDFTTRDAFDRHLAQHLNHSQIDLVVLAGWMHILGEGYLQNFHGRTINLHPALPGAYPGTNSIQRAWNDQVAESGCMVHEVILEIDAGKVLGTERLTLSDYSTLEDFEAAVHRAEHALLVRVVGDLVKESHSLK